MADVRARNCACSTAVLTRVATMYWLTLPKSISPLTRQNVMMSSAGTKPTKM